MNALTLIIAQSVAGGGDPHGGERLALVTILPALLLAAMVALSNFASGRARDARHAILYFWCVGYGVLMAPWAVLVSSVLDKPALAQGETGAAVDAITIGVPAMITTVLLRAWTGSRLVLVGSFIAGLLAVTIGTREMGVPAMIAWQILHACVLAAWANRARAALRRAAPATLCPKCGYDLRGLGGAACPECGPAADAAT